jgi:hypothetical protein
MIGISTLLALRLLALPPGARPTIPREELDSASMTLVVVQNDRSVPVTVYAQYEWSESKLGVVLAGASKTFRLSEYFLESGDVDFFVQPTGQAEEESGNMEIRRGEHVGVIVPPR